MEVPIEELWVGLRVPNCNKPTRNVDAAHPRTTLWAPRSSETLTQRPPVTSVGLAQGPVLVAFWLWQALEPKTPQIRVHLVRGFLEVVQSSSCTHLGPRVLVRAHLHFNKPSQLIPQGSQGKRRHLHSPAPLPTLWRPLYSSVVHPSKKRTNRTCHPGSQGCVAFKPQSLSELETFLSAPYSLPERETLMETAHLFESFFFSGPQKPLQRNVRAWVGDLWGTLMYWFSITQRFFATKCFRIAPYPDPWGRDLLQGIAFGTVLSNWRSNNKT